MRAEKSNQDQDQNQHQMSTILEASLGSSGSTRRFGYPSAEGATTGLETTRTKPESLACSVKKEDGTVILGIDPGNIQSAFVLWNGEEILRARIAPNLEFIDALGQYALYEDVVCAIEMVQSSYGMPVGKEIFNTVFWIGRFFERWCSVVNTGQGPQKPRPWMVYRNQVKKNLGVPNGKDKDVRQALIERIGEPGTKKSPGPTYGVTGDMWAALAVAIYYSDYLSRRASLNSPSWVAEHAS